MKFWPADRISLRILHIQIEREFIRDPAVPCNKTLSRRQREVLQLLAEGMTMKEAANVLCLTARTVAFRVHSIMEQFDIHTNLDLLRLAIREHLVSTG